MLGGQGAWAYAKLGASDVPHLPLVSVAPRSFRLRATGETGLTTVMGSRANYRFQLCRGRPIRKCVTWFRLQLAA